ncbi:hypothetical protein AKJ65_03515 [candidate division MSBL1 archaeon SCGC-AAA259E19]|uniref:PIN domain-containing protein n=1 Tax=candidate division MSBL1 archaeon SCGC-AAA259E19 TaxID=1698264 RepID=A0A133UKK2_9EURY|nr:hypothetical protein AKJ65_03515 [candidate division MSBL1 archaeon SCGC-AAA259E19]
MPVFDTEPLLTFYLDERGADKVEEELRKIKRGENDGYLNVVNLTEFYYIFSRRDREITEEKVRNLKSYGVEIVPVKDDELWIEAAKIKNVGGISLADAFAAATARVKGERLIVGYDEDFEGLGIPLVSIK